MQEGNNNPKQVLQEREAYTMNTWNRIEELMDFVKTHDIKELKDYWNHKEDEKRCNTVLAIIGAVAAVAAIAYAVYRYLTPDYLEDFDDDFDDDFEDDFFEDEEDEAEEKPEKSESAAEEEKAE